MDTNSRKRSLINIDALLAKIMNEPVDKDAIDQDLVYGAIQRKKMRTRDKN